MPKNFSKGNGDSGPGKEKFLIFDADGVAGTYTGSRGDDIYYIDDAEDQIIEKNSAGTDSVILTGAWTLGESVIWALPDNVENLSFDGNANFFGIGNDGDNIIIGNIGDDTLTGGEGSDFLDGGLGIDTARYLGSASDYLIDVEGETVYVTSLLSGARDTLTGIEWLVFDDSRIATASLLPEPTPPLVTASDSGQVPEDRTIIIDVLSNDTGDGLTVTEVTQGAFGSVSINEDGSLAYTPDPDVVGEDSFTYTVTDASGATLTESVSIEIMPVNDAPVAVDDSFSIGLGADYSGTLNTLENDTDPDGDALSVVAGGAMADALVSGDGSGAPLVFETTAGGSVTLNADGSFTYSAGETTAIEDSFFYSVSDGSGALSTAEVTLSLTAPAPEAPAPMPEPTPYYVDGLIYGDPYRLNAGDDIGTGVTVTYSFLSTPPDYYASDSSFATSFQAFTATQENVALEILSEIESFTNLTFVEVPQDQATLTFGLADLSGFAGLAYRPEGTAIDTASSDVWIDASYAFLGSGIENGTFQYTTLMHEIGHAIGLDHANLPDAEENQQYTIMDSMTHPSFSDSISSYQLYDVAALQYLYGANATDTAGDDIYRYQELANATHVIWDAGGNDTLDLSGATIGLNLDLNAGAFSDVTALGSDNVAIAFGTMIENAIGGDFDDVIRGNEADNWIDGGAGNDVLAGGAGLDTYLFSSGWGKDTIEDFAVGDDRLDFSNTGLALENLQITALDGNTILSDGANSVTLIGVNGMETPFDESALIF